MTTVRTSESVAAELAQGTFELLRTKWCLPILQALASGPVSRRYLDTLLAGS